MAYIINPTRSHSAQVLFSNQSLALQEKRIQEYVSQNPGTILKTFTETGDENRHRNRWPVLEEAVSFCIEKGAILLIGELRNLTNNESFSKQILRLMGEKRGKNEPSAEVFSGNFYCCDQPFIVKENFIALVEHARKQRELHGQLIKAGLSRTTAKSGNPHASDVISKVNKPKIDNAIVFALMLQPVINNYRLKGYSQRRMVVALNEDGFTAPEGGQWVLSQLQKVLERIKFNESALNLEKQFIEYRARKMSDSNIAELLNKLGVPSPHGKSWSDDCVDKVSERIKQLHDIIRFNEFVIELMPIIEKYHTDELTEEVFSQELKMIGVNIPAQPNP
ncbi:MAG: hypothetical protein JSR17_03435 [Proteobacteria bacterium]|nr:hypothetical protein [Pseudomonadota bacterium]